MKVYIVFRYFTGWDRDDPQVVGVFRLLKDAKAKVKSVEKESKYVYSKITVKELE